MAKVKTSIPEQIETALDGRTRRWLSNEVKIPETELSLRMTGKVAFRKEELQRIEKRLRFKLEY
jgi:hypothetical protein